MLLLRYYAGVNLCVGALAVVCALLATVLALTTTLAHVGPPYVSIREIQV